MLNKLVRVMSPDSRSYVFSDSQENLLDLLHHCRPLMQLGLMLAATRHAGAPAGSTG